MLFLELSNFPTLVKCLIYNWFTVVIFNDLMGKSSDEYAQERS